MSFLAKNVREIRFIFCKTSQTAVGIRNWVDTDMQRVKKLHPKVPIIIRNKEYVAPEIQIRYPKLRELHYDAVDVSPDMINMLLESLPETCPDNVPENDPNL